MVDYIFEEEATTELIETRRACGDFRRLNGVPYGVINSLVERERERDESLFRLQSCACLRRKLRDRNVSSQQSSTLADGGMREKLGH